MPERRQRSPSGLERLVRAGLAGTAVALPGAFVAAEYVGAGAFGLVVRAVLGVLCGAAAVAAAGGGGGEGGASVAGTGVRAVAAAYAVLGVATAFLLEGSVHPLSAGALPSYGVAALGALLWTLPGRARVRDGAGG